jgi:hypothetical protein
MGVTVENLEVFLDKDQKKWTVDDIVELRNTFNSIKDGNLDINKIKELKKAVISPAPKDDPFITAEVKEPFELKQADNVIENEQGVLIDKTTGKPI